MSERPAERSHLHHIHRWQVHAAGEEPRDPSGLELIQRERDDLPRQPDERQARRVSRREEVLVQGRDPARTEYICINRLKTCITHWWRRQLPKLSGSGANACKGPTDKLICTVLWQIGKNRHKSGRYSASLTRYIDA